MQAPHDHSALLNNVIKADRISHSSAREASPATSSIYVIKGERAILALQPLLVRFSEACGQSGSMQDLPYFLQKPGLLKRVPYLFLVAKRAGIAPANLQPQDLIGSLLLLEYRVLKIGTRAYATNDRSGRGTLLSAPEDRLHVAARVCGTLLENGAAIAMLSFLDSRIDESKAGLPDFESLPVRRTGSMQWAIQRRSLPSYLQLQPTLDDTLAGLGQKTRSNMRYYRRRAERDLGCTPVVRVDASIDELVQFNLDCMYPVDSATVRWRLKVLRALDDSFLTGMRDAEGRWLSVLAGRRFGDTSEILWQMNRAGYPTQSLGTVMRSYCIEQELKRGAKRLQVEGGTSHSMRNSFVSQEIVDLVVIRSRSRGLIRRLAQYFVRGDNGLAEMLQSESLQWHVA
jgi:hypothetical protein